VAASTLSSSATPRGWHRPGLLAALLFTLAPTFFWSGRVLDEEAVGFLRKYWGERGALEKVLDVRGWDFFQGRELSYAIDYLDARWLHLLVSHDVLFFVPPSSLLASLALVAVVLWLAPRALPRLSGGWRWLPLLLLLSGFVFVSTMGVLYRATKPLVGPLLLFLLLLSLAEHRQPRLRPRAAFWVALVAALALGSLDRQGLFYVLVLGTVLALGWLRTGRGAALLLGLVAGVAAWYAYFRLLAPPLIHAVEGYWPSTRFQRLRLARLADPQLWRQSVEVLGDWTSALFGGLPSWLLLLAVLVAAAAWGWRERARPARLAAWAVLAVGAALAQLAMVAIMLEHHPPIAWVSHRLWYYPFPYQVLLVFGLLFALDALAARRERALPPLLAAGLAGLVALNVLRWPEQRERWASDPPVADELRRSALLVRSLREGRAALLLDGDYRRLYFECLDLFPRLGAAAQAQVGEGGGVRVSEIQGGRVIAWAEPRSQLIPRTRAEGRYVLAGRARLRQGDTLHLMLGGRRLLAELSREAAGDGPVPFRVATDLPAGANDLQLVSSLPAVKVPDASRGSFAGFQLELPVLIWPAASP